MSESKPAVNESTASIDCDCPDDVATLVCWHCFQALAADGGDAPQCPQCEQPVRSIAVRGPSDAHAYPCGDKVSPSYVREFLSDDE